MPTNEDIETLDIFATPIWAATLPNFTQTKKSFIKFAESERKRDPVGVVKSNYTGYQSGDVGNALELKPIYDFILQKLVYRAIQDCKYNVNSASMAGAWFNFNDTLNAFNAPHIHGGIFSGIFYINAPVGSGDLVFLNNGHNDAWEGNTIDKGPTRYNSPNMKLHPEEGKIIIWNSHIPHYVCPNQKDVKRLSLAFNVRCWHQQPEEIKND